MANCSSSSNDGRAPWSISALRALLVIVLSVFLPACFSPVAKFTKQYKCQVTGKGDPRNAYEYVERGMGSDRLLLIKLLRQTNEFFKQMFD